MGASVPGRSESSCFPEGDFWYNGIRCCPPPRGTNATAPVAHHKQRTASRHLPTPAGRCRPHLSTNHPPGPTSFRSLTADKGHYVNFAGRGNPRRCWTCAHSPHRPPERPTGSPESPEITPPWWGTQPVSEPILPPRWGDADGQAGARQRRGRRSGRVPDLREAVAAGKCGRAHHRHPARYPRFRTRMAQEGFFGAGQGFGGAGGRVPARQAARLRPPVGTGGNGGISPQDRFWGVFVSGRGWCRLETLSRLRRSEGPKTPSRLCPPFGGGYNGF